jgi:polyadenylate-binding protein 2
VEIIQTDDIDRRSIYVKNVEYKSTEQQIFKFFKECGKINRVSIMQDKYTRQPKGYCYVEFSDPASVDQALLKFNQRTFNGRTIDV